MKMKPVMDVIVIGGGASGMMAAISAAKHKKKVLILEHNDKLGKKILMTGNGRCNITNQRMEESCYGKEHSFFAMQVISDFDLKAVMNFFEANGVLLHDRNGYIYPYSDQASQINEAFSILLKHYQVNIHLETHVEQITCSNQYDIITSRGRYSAKKVILATGSKAYPKSGSDGSGYQLALALGHNIVTVLPALTALEDNTLHHKLVSGVRCDAGLTLMIEGQECARERGELQLTDYGISGIPTFQISRYAVKALHQKKSVTCEIDFLPEFENEYLISFLMKKKKLCSNLLDLVNGMVNKKILDLMLRHLHLDGQKHTNEISKKDVEQLVGCLKQYPINITGYKSFDYGQVCQGGVSIHEIHPQTMESTILTGLYFCGEIVDVDGICGGYNLQWAFSSGYKAGDSAAK